MSVILGSNRLLDPAETLAHYEVIRRNGKLTHFDVAKITVAMTKAFLAVEGGKAAASSRIHEIVAQLSAGVSEALFRRLPDGGSVHIEAIQDQVELALMRNGHQQVARAYVLYREERARRRNDESAQDGEAAVPTEIQITQTDGSKTPLDRVWLEGVVVDACHGLDAVSTEQVLTEIQHNLYDGIAVADVGIAMTLSARVLIDQDPNYAYVAARLLLNALQTEVLDGLDAAQNAGPDGLYPAIFADTIQRAIGLELLDPELGRFDLQRLSQALQPQRDRQFTYLGLQTLYDRYFLHSNGQRLELPQIFFMRVAMGLAINEIDRESRAIEFYELLSSFDFMSSTPTLFNSGTLRPQLSSCYLTTLRVGGGCPAA